MTLLSTENLEAVYSVEDRKIKILNGINLSVASGELIAIEGPSGSGKSTLLHILAGLKSHSSGSLKILERDVPTSETYLAALRNKLFGFIFQDFHLIPHFSVLGNVLLPGRYSDQNGKNLKTRALSLLDELGLKELIHRKPTQLSGGQQQRTAIARALLLNPQVIFADEPTGALDSKTALDVMNLLKKLHQNGHTVIIVTHDTKVAEKCQRRIRLKDGEIVYDEKTKELEKTNHSENQLNDLPKPLALKKASILKTAFQSILRYKMRSALSVFGLCIGIMSLLIMMSISEFTKNKILESYQSLGANQLNVSGYRNWRHDSSKESLRYSKFREFDLDRDIKPLYKVFPQVGKVAPFLKSWNGKAQFGGEVVNEISLLGTTPEYFEIEKRTAIAGELMSHHNLHLRQNVCHIGIKIARSLFKKTNPIGQTMNLTIDRKQIPCRVSAVLSKRGSKSEWEDPDNMVAIPLTYFKLFSSPWSSKIRQFKIEAKVNSDLDKLSRGLKNYYLSKYGKSINFHINSDDLLVANLKKFILFFNILLLMIAGVTLLAGGASVTNLMLISLSERVREIGIRKAYGATPKNLLLQMLCEGLVLSCIAGIIGIGLGFASYQTGLFMASKFSEKISYEIFIYEDAFIVSAVSIFLVGVLSSLIPAVKIKKIETVEALRSH